jgi:hypothetical protein
VVPPTILIGATAMQITSEIVKRKFNLVTNKANETICVALEVSFQNYSS